MPFLWVYFESFLKTYDTYVIYVFCAKIHRKTLRGILRCLEIFVHEPKAGMRSAKPANRLEKPGFLRELGTELFLSSYVLYVLQALWNLSERIGLAKARGLSKEGMCHFSCFILYT